MAASQTVSSPAHDAAAPHVHIVSPKVLLTVFGALMVMTAATVAVTTVNLGIFNIWVALAIAVIKATLVALYFMHLRWDSRFNGIILSLALFIVALFIGIAMLDSTNYKRAYDMPGTVATPP